MEYALYVLGTLGFGFICWCIGVVMGAKHAVKQIVDQL